MAHGLRTRLDHEDKACWRADARAPGRGSLHVRFGQRDCDHRGDTLGLRRSGADQPAGPRFGPKDKRLKMPTNWKSRAGWLSVLTLVILAAAWFAWPRPVAVDIALVSKGPMEVTIDEEAKTRVRHVYTVSAPVAGKVLRISHPLGEQGPSIHVGDQVKAAETVVANMQPTAPSFLDVRFSNRPFGVKRFQTIHHLSVSVARGLLLL